MNIKNNSQDSLRAKMQDLLRASNNNTNILVDINKTDREARNLEYFNELIKNGRSAQDLFKYLKSDNVHLTDFMYFLDVSHSSRRVDVYDEVLRLAFKKFGVNAHLAYRQAKFGKLNYINSEQIIDILVKSNVFKYIELGLNHKAKSLNIDINLVEVQNLFEQIKATNLPEVFKFPYIEIFSGVVRTMKSRKPDGYDLRVNKLIDLFKIYLGEFKHPWHLRLFIRLHMAILKNYDSELYISAYKALQSDVYDLPTAKLNLLHLYNYYHINNLKVEDKFLDEYTERLIDNHPSTILLRSTMQSLEQKSSKRKKIGVIVAGQIRGMKSGQLFLKNAEGYEFDVFIACWEKKGFKIPYNVVAGPYYRIFDKDIVEVFYAEGILGNQLYQRYPSIERLLLEGVKVDKKPLENHKWVSDEANYSIKNVSTYSEDEGILEHIFDEFRLKQMSNNAMNNQLKMFYMNYCGYQSLCEEEDKSQETYEYIIKVRPDMEMSIDIDCTIKELEGKQAVSVDVLRPYDCGDRIAIGNRIIMGQYLKMFENLNIYQNQPKKMFGCGVFKAHAPIDYQIVSSGGQVYRSKYVENGEYIELDLVDRDILISGMLEDAKARGLDNIDIRIFESLGVRT